MNPASLLHRDVLRRTSVLLATGILLVFFEDELAAMYR